VDALETVRVLPWALETSVFGTSLHVMVHDEAEGKRRISDTLGAHGIRAERVERITPSLEDVFLYLLEKNVAERRT
jgi:ABC-2 type transport system ATP-binding protein